MRDYDPADPLELVKLRAASDEAVRKTQPACEMRLKVLRQIVGPYYPGDGESGSEKRPVNLMELASDIFLRNLASHNPQALIETDFEELLPTAHDFETVLNRKITRMKLRDAFNTCALEALVTMGVMCVGVGLDGEYDGGSVFAEPVLFPDLVLDLSAQSWGQQSFVGHEFLVPLEWVEENEELHSGPREEFVAWSRAQQFSASRDWNRAGGGLYEEYEKLVRLRQLYLPRRKKLVLFAVDGPSKDPLRVTDWDGPYCGPYIPLSFRTIPGNVFPLGPLLSLYDLDDFVNHAFSKAFRQAERCKTIGLSQGAEDAATIQGSNDGEIKGVTSPDTVVERTFGGANRNVVDSANMAMALFMKLGGNLDLLGGLAPSSGTVGQDQLLAQGATGRMKEMQQTMTEFETEVINSVAHWVWEDPTGEEKFTKRLEGTAEGISETWPPENLEGEFYQLNLSATPYSRINRSPSEEAQFLTQFLEQVMLPSLPYMQQGSPIDWEVFYKEMARLNNCPRINMLINWPGGESMPAATPDRPKPTQTTRRYERINKQGGDVNPLDSAMKAFSASSSSPDQSMAPVTS